MTGQDEPRRDLAALVVPLQGSLVATGDPWEPYRLVDAAGEVVVGVQSYLVHLQAAGRATATQRSYGMDLLRWFRFLWAVEVAWQQARRIEARDFTRWMHIASRPVRAHWRSRTSATPPEGPGSTHGCGSSGAAAVAGVAGPVSSDGYAAATRAHSETVLRHFYDFHLEAGTGPLINPFPLARGRDPGRAHAHHNPMDDHSRQRSGLFRPRLSEQAPRHIPDEGFNELFAALSCDRDRALVAFWISSGARASELLGATQGDADVGRQLISVIRKGSRALQQLPASPDAFVWLRLYQAQMHDLVPLSDDEPLWWTLRRPFRALSYHAAYRMFARVNATIGAGWTLHDLRHTAAYRMARDPQVPLTDVQWVLGHAQLSTTQRYVSPTAEDVIASVLGHYARRAAGQTDREQSKVPIVAYRSESLDVLFNRGGR
jgi:integrase